MGANGGIILISTLPGFAPTTAGASNAYTLINAANITGGALSLSPASTNTLAPGLKESLSATSTAVTLTVASAPAGNFYWQGGAPGSSWYANVSAGGATNWTTNSAGGADAGFTPAAWNTVNFIAGVAARSSLTTTLDQNFSIAGLVVNNAGTGSSGAATLTINPGNFNGTLTIGSGGINVQTSAPSTFINANVALSASQTWTVADSGSTLATSGNISGTGFSITTAGAGTFTFSGYNTFSSGLSAGAGTGLNINNGGISSSTSALGTGALTLATGVTIDNTSPSSELVLTNNAQTWNATTGAFALNFTGSNSLSMGTGAVTTTAGSAITITVNGGTLAEGRHYRR